MDKKKVIIIGGTSGMGETVARLYAAQGNTVGITGRRKERLANIASDLSGFPIHTAFMDVMSDESTEILKKLIKEMGGVDICLYAAGYGHVDVGLDTENVLREIRTNAEGFARCAVTLFNWWAENKKEGQLAVLSSVAGIRPLGISSGYSATKKFQSFYAEALRQLAVTRKVRISITVIKPGFVDTDFIAGRNFPLTFSKEKAAGLIIRAIEKKRKTCIIDGRWKAVTRLMYLLPGPLWRSIGRFFPASMK